MSKNFPLTATAFSAFVLATSATILHTLAFPASSTAQTDSAPIVSSYFDENTDGWSLNTGSLQHQNSGGSNTYSGNSKGYIRFTDPVDSLVSYYLAPVKYLGDLRPLRTLEFELQSNGGKYSLGDPKTDADVIISNGKRTAKYFFGKRPNSSWETFVVSLNAPQGWIISPRGTSLKTILSNVTELKIRAEYGAGKDFSGLDNVEFWK